MAEFLGEYRLLAKLGAGSFGIVYKAENGLGDLFAIKSIHFTKKYPEVRYLLRREISVMRSLAHPNIVRLQQVLQTPDEVHLVTELAAGGDLRDYLNNNDLLYDGKARQLFSQLIDAIHFTHQKGWVHRDLKLENILLDEFDNIKLADWGFACKWSPNTRLTEPVGSVHYAAPELLCCRPYTGPECDAWSLGVILYALVTSSLPFMRRFDEFTDDEMRSRIKLGDFSIPNHVSGLCANLIRGLLEVNPAKRLSVDEAMRHPWLTGYGGPKVMSTPLTFSVKNALRMSR